MKLVQIIRPLFFVALGLHGLLLFVPLGAEPELVEEDVELAELESAQNPSIPPAAGQLPVADPNAAARPNPAAANNARTTTARGASGTAATRGAAGRRAAGTQVAVNPGAANNRRPNSRPNVTPTPTGDTTVSPGSDSQQGNQSDNSPSQNQGSSTADSENSSSAESGGPTISLNTRNADDDVENSESTSNANDAQNASDTDPAEESLFAQLLSGATGRVTPALVNFVSGFQYDAALVTPTSTEARINEWKASLQVQATGGQLVAMEPEMVDDPLEINYPLRAVSNEKVRSLQVCLSRPPENPVIGVHFDHRGELASEPVALHSTGYKTLDQEISMLVATSDKLPSDRRSKAYMVETSINYDEERCLNLADVVEDDVSSE